MNNIAPLLPQLQSTPQSPETAGASRGSETGFGRIFNETLSHKQQSLSKDPATKPEPAGRSGRPHNGKPLEQQEPASATRKQTEPVAAEAGPEAEQTTAPVAENAAETEAGPIAEQSDRTPEQNPLPDAMSTDTTDEQTSVAAPPPATDASAGLAAQLTTSTEKIASAADTGKAAAIPAGHTPDTAIFRQAISTARPPEGLVGNAGSEAAEASLQATRNSEKSSDQAASPFRPTHAARVSMADQVAMPVEHDPAAFEAKSQALPTAATSAMARVGEASGNHIATHPTGKKDNAAADTISIKGNRTIGNPAAPTAQPPLPAGAQATASSNEYSQRPTVLVETAAVAISINGEGPLTSISPKAEQPPLWSASGSSQAEGPITISGYFASTKPLSAQANAAKMQGLSSDVPIPETAQTIASSGQTVTAGAKTMPTPGLDRLVSLAEKSPLHMADPVATTTLSAGGTTESAPLIASLQELTTLRKPGQESREGLRQNDAEPLRHQQFKELALEPKNSGEMRGNDAGNQQPGGRQETATGGQPQSLSPWTATAPASDQPHGFTQLNQAAPIQGTLVQNTVPIDQPQSAPPPAPTPQMQDEQVFFQVAERFQLQMRNQQTRLNIQLHPAELGKLDISLSVKEGSIRAHVVAQSGKVRELLERNMNRLRGILENQGFSIEEILVSARSEIADNADLFQEQPAWRTSPAGPQSQNLDTHFDETLESLVSGSGSSTTSVNITA